MTVTGLLIKKSNLITPILFGQTSENSYFEVPQGKKLILKSSTSFLYSGNGFSADFSYPQIEVFPSGTKLSLVNEAPVFPSFSGFTGYLLNN